MFLFQVIESREKGHEDDAVNVSNLVGILLD